MRFFAATLAPWALVALTSVSSAVAAPGLVERQSTSTASANTVTPLTPSLTDEGSPLLIQWDTTTNEAWNSMEIKFMTGSNQNMTELYTVATAVDGTSAGAGKLLWTAPNVRPNSNIYFFQFTHSGQDPTWTTRFAIADASGAVTAPPFAKQPEGPAIPWGNGRIVSGAVASSASSNSTLTSASASASGSSALVSSSSSAPVSSASASASASSNSAALTSQPSASASSGSSSSSNVAQDSNDSSSSSSSSQTSAASTTARVGSAAVVGCVVAALAGAMLV